MQSIIKRTQVAYHDAPAPETPPERVDSAAQPSTACEKSVQLLRVDGEVRAVELRCSCGEVTTFELQYEDTGG